MKITVKREVERHDVQSDHHINDLCCIECIYE